MTSEPASRLVAAALLLVACLAGVAVWRRFEASRHRFAADETLLLGRWQFASLDDAAPPVVMHFHSDRTAYSHTAARVEEYRFQWRVHGDRLLLENMQALFDRPDWFDPPRPPEPTLSMRMVWESGGALTLFLEDGSERFRVMRVEQPSSGSAARIT